jgi:hypothetical protein
MGTLSSPTGAQIALPFYAKFSNEQEAMEFAENHLQVSYSIHLISEPFKKSILYLAI